jgi:chorismate-pyruvate lyase
VLKKIDIRAKKKWTTFAYVAEKVTHIRKLKKQNLEVVFKTKNTIGKVLNMKKLTFNEPSMKTVAYIDTDI